LGGKARSIIIRLELLEVLGLGVLPMLALRNIVQSQSTLGHLLAMLGVPLGRDNTNRGTGRAARALEWVVRDVTWTIDTDEPASMALSSAPSSATHDEDTERSNCSQDSPNDQKHPSNSSRVVKKRSVPATDSLTEPSWIRNNMGEGDERAIGLPGRRKDGHKRRRNE